MEEYHLALTNQLVLKKLSILEKEYLEANFDNEEICEVIVVTMEINPQGRLMKFIMDFHKNSEIVKEVNYTFITLIPKYGKPEMMVDFRPISSVGSIYKILAKVLTNHVKKTTLGNIWVLGKKWRKWIKDCISFSFLSVIINGSPTQSFGFERGLHQGDTLSPFLFNMVVEGLSCLFRKALVMGMIKRTTFGENGLQVSHLIHNLQMT
ncbi:hypothetical protein Ddye_024701 [Dipteronia dyeriana]|uniref:Reverse transcriptase domain-containing protein n=1 Tax=Dipteronia dyeriana TaxID=168575 RepID=A0AAD9TWD3_9ROSI|nr:hypothetical protein Ddye_024701 [Dipteronia dyeriana]